MNANENNENHISSNQDDQPDDQQDDQQDDIIYLDIADVLYKPMGTGIFHFLPCQNNPCHCEWVAINEHIPNGESALQYYGAFTTNTFIRGNIINGNDISQQRKLYEQIIIEANNWFEIKGYNFRIEAATDTNFHRYLDVIKKYYNYSKFPRSIDR